MILHKIFHLNQSVENARLQLADLSSYRHQLDGVERMEPAGQGTTRWQLRLAPLTRVNLVVSEAESSASDTMVFKSVGGDAEVFGAVTFHAIRPRLTEVDVTLDYQFRSPALRLLDRVFGLGDRFLVQHLRSTRAHFEDVPTPARHREVGAAMPALTLKAA